MWYWNRSVDFQKKKITRIFSRKVRLHGRTYIVNISCNYKQSTTQWINPGLNNFLRPKVTLNDGSATSQNNTQQMNAITNTTIIATEKIQNLRNSNTLGEK